MANGLPGVPASTTYPAVMSRFDIPAAVADPAQAVYGLRGSTESIGVPKPVAASSPVHTATRRAISGVLSGALVLPLLLGGCGSVQKVRNLVVGPPSPYLSGYIGSVVADEPVAALAGRDVLARGGNAADAAAAVGMALAVTLPSRASLGGGGACLAYRAGDAQPQAFLFTPIAGTAAVAGGRPASVPMTARGLFLMQARYGSVSFDDLVKPAARLARSGITVSRALSNDLEAVRGPLFSDPTAAAIFARPGGEPVQTGDQLLQPDLASTLDRLAIAGVGDLYTGLLWQAYVEGAALAHGGLTASDIRNAIPGEGAPLVVPAGNDRVAFLPPPADGGLGSAAAFSAIESGGSGAGVAQATVSAWRAAHPPGISNEDLVAEAQSLVSTPDSGGGASLGRLPASTSFTVVDRKGGAVACALTMDNLFGTGRIAGDTGIVLGASPARLPAPLLSAAIAWSPGAGTLRAAVAGSGQNQAAEAVAQATSNALHNQAPSPVTDTGRVNAISCSRGSEHCVATADPRGDGLATRSE